jgi:hypothetical protein
LKRAAAIVVMSALLSAAPGYAKEVDWGNAEQVGHLPPEEVCVAYHRFRLAGDQADAAKVQRSISAIPQLRVRPEDWPHIELGAVRLGMSECAVIAAWGLPKERHYTEVPGVYQQHWVWIGAASRIRIVFFEINKDTMMGPFVTAITD